MTYSCDWCGKPIKNDERSVYTVMYHMLLHHPCDGHDCMAQYQKLIDDCNDRKRDESFDFVVGPSTD